MAGRWTQAVLAVGVLAVGAGVAAALVLTRPTPAKTDQLVRGPLVRVVHATRTDVPVTVYGHGEVVPTVTAHIIPQVSGRVVEAHPNLHSGGYVPAGQPLLKLDRIDFELAVKRAEAERLTSVAGIKAAESRLAEASTRVADTQDDLRRTKLLSEQNAANAREVEKAQVGYDLAAAGRAEAEASLASAKAQLEAAEVQSQRAQIDLERTTVTLPFDAVVIEESVDVGQFLTVGQSLGEAYGTSSVEVSVPLDDGDLRWIAGVPLGPLGASEGAVGHEPTRVEVEADFAGRACVWEGRVVRTGGRIDSRTRMISVVVRVDDPFVANEQRPPLMPGSFVRLGIEGRTLTGVIPLPRYALHADDTVWVVEDGKLRIKPVEVARRERDRVLIAAGLDDGAAVVVSPLEAPADGADVRIETDEEGAMPERGDARAGGGAHG